MGKGTSKANRGSFFEAHGTEEERVGQLLDRKGGVNGKLTKAEVDAVTNYHYGSSTTMNDRLRNGEGLDGTGFSKKELDALDAAINKGSLKENTILYRGIGKQFLGMDFSNPKSVVGKSFTDKGYSSTSSSKQVATTYSRGVVMRIKARKGTRGVYVDGASQSRKELRQFAREGDGGNYEVLLKRNTKFKVTGYHKKNGQIIYDVTV